MGKVVNKISFPYGIQGILPDEITVAEALRASGYRTAAFGKWHLGDKSPSLPNDKGFEYFFGAHYSVDMDPYLFYRNREPISPEPVDKSQLTPMLTEEITAYIDEHHDEPFFIYYPSPYPHHPAHASEAFAGKSKGGTYGDCVEELDWSVGEIYKKLEQYGVEKDTLFIFTSDNGPWFEGNPGLHRGRKGLSFDGGQMVPFVACWPNVIPAGTEIDNTAMNIDFFPTFLEIAGISLPEDREIDGLSILPLLKGEVEENLHDELCFISFKTLFGIRDKDNFKYTIRHKHDTQRYTMLKQGPFLFDLNNDQNESYDMSDHYPEKKEVMRKKLEEIKHEFETNPRGWK
jgi:arylsulfatase A-like enzyme